MGVGFRGSGEVKVQYAGDVLKINSSGDSIVLLLAGELAALVLALGVGLLGFFILVAGCGSFVVFVLFSVLGLLGLARSQDFLLVGGDDDVVDTLVELLHDVQTGVDGQFGVENTALDAELFEEQLHTVAAVDVSHEDDDLSLDQLQLENNVGEEELLVLGASIVTVGLVSR